MNILVVCLYPKEADPIFSISIAKALKNQNHNVYALLEKSIINVADWNALLPVNNIEYIDIEKAKSSKFRKYIKYANAALYTLMGAKSALPKLANIEFDLTIYTFYHHWNDILIRKLQSKENILYLHDPVPHSDEDSRRFALQKNQVKKMDKIVLLTKKFVPIVEEQYETKLENIIVSTLGNMQHSGVIEKVCDYSDVKVPVNFLSFGRITEYKGIHVLLAAYRKAKESHPNVTLTIAGNGDFSEYKEEAMGLSDLKLYNRFIEDSEIVDFFTVPNTVVVLPYLDATQSGIIPIAAMYGNPVIASDTGGLREQLADGSLGLYANPGDSDSLAEAMVRVADDTTLRQAEAKKMRWFYKSLDWDVIVEKLIRDLRTEETIDCH